MSQVNGGIGLALAGGDQSGFWQTVTGGNGTAAANSGLSGAITTSESGFVAWWDGLGTWEKLAIIGIGGLALMKILSKRK